MKNILKARGKSIAVIVVFSVVVGATLLVVNREKVALKLFQSSTEIPPLSDPALEGDEVEWFDDYYTIERIDEQTIAIGEPRYFQQNYNYLILGKEKAVLFDTGPGVRDITPVVESLTDLPVVVTQSHLHYDHVGNHERFENIAMLDLPYLRKRAPQNELALDKYEHLGYLEGYAPPTLKITEWWTPGETIDLGGRSLKVVHAPGHTPDSMILIDEERGQLFAGDYLYEGDLFAFLPGSNLADYLSTANRLQSMIEPCKTIYPAHRLTPPGTPAMACDSIHHLADALTDIRDGKRPHTGIYPAQFTIKGQTTIMTDIPALIDWD